MYTTDALPEHWIISDAAGWHLVPNIPDGWAQRTTYRGYVEALRRVSQPVAASMARLVGYQAE